MKELTKSEQAKIDELTQFKKTLIDYMLKLGKVTETPADYEAFKPINKQIYALEDLIDAMRDAIYAEEAQQK